MRRHAGRGQADRQRGRGRGGDGSSARGGGRGGENAWFGRGTARAQPDAIQIEVTNTGSQLSTVPDEPVPSDPVQPPSRLEIRKASMHDFVPSSPNSARAKRSPKSSSYATRYEGRINSPGSLMSPKSNAAALVGASARDESAEESRWRMRLEPRVVRRSSRGALRLPALSCCAAARHGALVSDTRTAGCAGGAC